MTAYLIITAALMIVACIVSAMTCAIKREAGAGLRAVAELGIGIWGLWLLRGLI